eukprot:8372779-Pyramimonas_sp.AAC.1
MDNPVGKRPDALARAVLFRMAEAVEGKEGALLAAASQGIEPMGTKAALDELLRFGALVQDQKRKFVTT